MKKFLTLLLTVIMSVACCMGLTACGDNGKMKVGLICLHGESSTYDKNFIEAFKLACQSQDVEYIIETDVAESAACYDKAKELANKGCSIVFADSFGHEQFIIQAAREFPNVQFCHATGTKAHTENLANFHNAFANIYEGRYVAGVAAGLKLKAMMMQDATIVPKIGYVGAYPFAEVVSGYTAWYLGVKSIVSNVTMDVKYTFSWYDEAAEKLAAKDLIAGGCVLLSQHADSMGAPTACEDAGVPNVSYNGSTVSSCPDTFIISSRINWQPYYEYVISKVKANKASEIAKDYSAGFGDMYCHEQGTVLLTQLGNNVFADDQIEYVKGTLIETMFALKTGELKVFDCSTFTVGGETITTYLADVDDRGDYVGETEAIKTEKGITYFAESEFRSAPYFDLRIDGITEINPSQN